MSDPADYQAMRAMFPPIDWTKSTLGRDVWEAWNALDGAIARLKCAQLHEISECATDLEITRKDMVGALRRRDTSGL